MLDQTHLHIVKQSSQELKTTNKHKVAYEKSSCVLPVGYLLPISGLSECSMQKQWVGQNQRVPLEVIVWGLSQTTVHTPDLPKWHPIQQQILSMDRQIAIIPLSKSCLRAIYPILPAIIWEEIAEELETCSISSRTINHSCFFPPINLKLMWAEYSGSMTQEYQLLIVLVFQLSLRGFSLDEISVITNSWVHLSTLFIPIKTIFLIKAHHIPLDTVKK